jgi:two-component system cell cycle sensor histidine kinase/response regulator CckA
MEAVGTLAGGIAHDFNNILAIILGNAELAFDDVPDGNPAKESLKEIRLGFHQGKGYGPAIACFQPQD